MKYLSQFLIIMSFTLAGEALQRIIPLPIPASVYGLVLLFLCLQCRIIKPEAVQNVGDWMISILPVFFVAPGVSILGCWNILSEKLVPLTIILLSTTILIFVVSGKVSQAVRKGGRQNG